MGVIAAIEAIPVRAPRAKAMVSAGGLPPLIESLFGLVRIRTTDGLEGIGEISMNGHRSGAEQCQDVNGIFAPALLGTDPTRVQQAALVMDRLVDGSEPAKAGVEMALWDITGKAQGRPLYDLLGGQVRDRVPVRWGLGFGEPGAGAAEAVARVQQGFRTIKVKIGRSGTGLDESMIAAVRREVGESINLVVDANGAYRNPLEALVELGRLEMYGLQLIEQPLGRRRLEEMAMLRLRLRAPILVDESMRGWTDAWDVARSGAADVLGVYVCEAGGILATMKAAAVGQAAGLTVTLGSQCELGIGTAAMAHVATCLPNLAYESDITGHLRYPVDIINETITYEAGAVLPPPGPGLGVSVNEDVLMRWRLNT